MALKAFILDFLAISLIFTDGHMFIIVFFDKKRLKNFSDSQKWNVLSCGTKCNRNREPNVSK